MTKKPRLRDLNGLGPKSEAWLCEVGIDTPERLRETGAVAAFVKLQQECSVKPSMNFLYALVGALEDRHWTAIARTEKGRLLTELDGYCELQRIMAEQDSGS
ncbi:TfoX/Sxy family protein [Marinobacterium sp. D7]|uniref:TfoX/Sxy family protein n=1 Tax=Marinobacterium ramblicola TaxID=2849041 RepID=UPI001C2D9471|nr:TfoX/Sxy family protein [Marinobacterium ramblicola]MBV1787505.1 TfoX/Sxy family protein [Marinobacterium ramblicola]